MSAVLHTTDSRALPYPAALAPYLRGEAADDASRRRHYARLLRSLFGATRQPSADPRTLAELRERLARPGGLTHPETAALVLALCPLRRCPWCGRRVLACDQIDYCCLRHKDAHGRRVEGRRSA